MELYAKILTKSGINALTAHHPGKFFLESYMRQRISSFHGEFYLLDMLHTKTFPTDDAYTYSFTILALFKAIVTFQHI
jgi:hypothetical protein